MRGVMTGSVLALVAFLGVSACNGGESKSSGTSTTQPAADIGDVLATVNGVSIGSKEFEQAAARKTPANGDALSAEEKKEVLDGLVEEKLLYAEALKEGLDKDPKVQKVMVNTLVREKVFNTLKNSDFPDEVLQKYYDDHKSEFIVPEKVQIKRILVKVGADRTDADAKKLADQLRAQVAKNPDSFKDVAAQSSEDPYKRRGGDVGFVAKDGKPGLDQAIVDKAFTLEVNQPSDAFKTDEGYNIVMIAARREQIERTFQQMKGTVLRKAKNAKQQELYDGYVADLKKGATIKIEQEKLDKLEVKSARRPFAPGLGGDDDMMEGAGMEGAEPGEGAEGAPTMPGSLPGPGGAPSALPGLKPGMMPGRPGAMPGANGAAGPGARPAGGAPAAGGK